METSLCELFELSPRTVLRLRGPDRERFLNGQVSQDVRLATGSEAVYAAVLNPKGQLAGVCHIREEQDSYLLDAPLALREDLLARLERYLIADDVELTDESDDWYVAHLRRDDPPPEILSWRCTRLRSAGFDLFAREPISVEGATPLAESEFEHYRIYHGIPAWGAELTPGLLPPEADLDASAISYDKGCYLGQEVISRMKRAGKTNQHLVRLNVSADAPVPGTLLHEGAVAGRVTSVSGREGGVSAIALGFRKRKFAEIDRFDLGDATGAPVPGIATLRAEESEKTASEGSA